MTIGVNHCDRAFVPSSAGGTGAWPRPATVTVLTWLLLFAAELVASLALCDFRLIFTLDDAYIHLAVADQSISMSRSKTNLSGGYGVNAGEYSSPSSSIIWPYVLALTEALRLGAFGPLLINAAAAGATVFAILRLLEASGLFELRNPRRQWFRRVAENPHRRKRSGPFTSISCMSARSSSSVSDRQAHAHDSAWQSQTCGRPS